MNDLTASQFYKNGLLFGQPLPLSENIANRGWTYDVTSGYTVFLCLGSLAISTVTGEFTVACVIDLSNFTNSTPRDVKCQYMMSGTTTNDYYLDIILSNNTLHIGYQGPDMESTYTGKIYLYAIA